MKKICEKSGLHIIIIVSTMLALPHLKVQVLKGFKPSIHQLPYRERLQAISNEAQLILSRSRLPTSKRNQNSGRHKMHSRDTANDLRARQNHRCTAKHIIGYIHDHKDHMTHPSIPHLDNFKRCMGIWSTYLGHDSQGYSLVLEYIWSAFLVSIQFKTQIQQHTCHQGNLEAKTRTIPLKENRQYR